MLADGGADRLHDAGVDADQVVAAHAGLAGNARGNDHDIGARNDRIVAAAGHLGVEAFDRGRLCDVQRLAVRHAFRDVEHGDVAKFLQACQQGERAADLAGADERDFIACHEAFPKCCGDDYARERGSLLAGPDDPQIRAGTYSDSGRRARGTGVR